MRLTKALLLIVFLASPETVAAQRMAQLTHGVATSHALALGEATGNAAARFAPPADRATHIGRGALWGAAIYAVLAAGYVAHESATCHGADCFGEGFAWIGLIEGVPFAVGVGAAVGALWPVASPQPPR